MRGLKPETRQALKDNKYLLKALMPNAIISEETKNMKIELDALELNTIKIALEDRVTMAVDLESSTGYIHALREILLRFTTLEEKKDG